MPGTGQNVSQKQTAFLFQARKVAAQGQLALVRYLGGQASRTIGLDSAYDESLPATVDQIKLAWRKWHAQQVAEYMADRPGRSCEERVRLG